MGISITKSNVLLGTTPVIDNDFGAGQTPSHITSYDHSLNYTSGTQDGAFAVSFGSLSNIEYVALSGHNMVASEPAELRLFDEDTLIQSVTLSRNNNVMFTFDSMNFTNMNLRFITLPSNRAITISYVAAGQLIDVEEGEQAGYKRNWLKRSIKQRTTSNRTSAPVSAIQKTEPLSATLNIPNIDAHLSQNEYQDFIDYTFEQPFFIKEVEDLPESSYICYDPEHDIVAHRATPLLNRATIKFNAYNGLE